MTDRHLIEQAMNTHGNGGHWFGNELPWDGIPIVATAAALEEMRAGPPALLHALFKPALSWPEFNAFGQRTMRRLEFEGIEPRLPTEAFSGASWVSSPRTGRRAGTCRRG